MAAVAVRAFKVHKALSVTKGFKDLVAVEVAVLRVLRAFRAFRELLEPVPRA